MCSAGLGRNRDTEDERRAAGAERVDPQYPDYYEYREGDIPDYLYPQLTLEEYNERRQAGDFSKPGGRKLGGKGPEFFGLRNPAPAAQTAQSVRTAQSSTVQQRRARGGTNQFVIPKANNQSGLNTSANTPATGLNI